MKYRELLDLSKSRSGCIWTNEQRKKESAVKYQLWMEKMNEASRSASTNASGHTKPSASAGSFWPGHF